MRIAALTTVADDSRTMLKSGLAPMLFRSSRRCSSPCSAQTFLREHRVLTGAWDAQGKQLLQKTDKQLGGRGQRRTSTFTTSDFGMRLSDQGLHLAQCTIFSISSKDGGVGSSRDWVQKRKWIASSAGFNSYVLGGQWLFRRSLSKSELPVAFREV